jgi:hypothetical protein
MAASLKENFAFQNKENFAENDSVLSLGEGRPNMILDDVSDIEKNRLRIIGAKLSKSKTARKLLSNAFEQGYCFCFANISANGVANHTKRMVVLNPHLDNDRLSGTLAHELRHVWQENGKIKFNAFANDIASNLKINFAKEADAVTFGAVVAWELKEQGDLNAWKGMKRNQPKAAKIAEKMAEGKDSLSDDVKTEIFKSWFENKYYKDVYSKSILDFYQAKVSNSKVVKMFDFEDSFSSDEIISSVCCDCDKFGENYFKAPKNFLDRLPSYLVKAKRKAEFVEFANTLERFGGAKDKSVSKLQSEKKKKISVCLSKAISHLRIR